jgi:hypothetical protein
VIIFFPKKYTIHIKLSFILIMDNHGKGLAHALLTPKVPSGFNHQIDGDYVRNVGPPLFTLLQHGDVDRWC